MFNSYDAGAIQANTFRLPSLPTVEFVVEAVCVVLDDVVAAVALAA